MQGKWDRKSELSSKEFILVEGFVRAAWNGWLHGDSGLRLKTTCMDQFDFETIGNPNLRIEATHAQLSVEA